MKRILFLVTIAAMSGVLFFSSAQMRHYEIEVDDFERLIVIDDIEVEYTSDASKAGLAVFDATPSVAENIIFNTRSENTIAIQLGTEIMGLDNLPVIRIYSTRLHTADNRSDSILRITQLAPVDEFKAVLSENGRIIVHGIDADEVELKIATGNGKIIADGREVKTLKLNCLGTGEVQADQLPAQEIKCRIVGTGTIGCHIKDGPLSITGTGTGKVYYKGSPSKIKMRKLGSIKAIAM